MTDQAPWEGDPNAPLHPVVATYGAVGMIASVWSALERAIDTSLWIMSGVDPDAGKCLTSQIQSVRAKLITLETLVHLRGGDEKCIKAIRKFQNECEDPSRKRNRIIHNPIYGHSESSIVLGIISADRKLVDEEQPIDPLFLKNIFNEIGSLCGKFGQLINEHVEPVRQAWLERKRQHVQRR